VPKVSGAVSFQKRQRLLYVQYTNPAAYPPLVHSAELLAEAGWWILSLGTGARRSGALRGPEHPHIRWLRLPYCRPGVRQRIHYLVFWLSAIVLTLLARPRWIYASDHLSCPVAWVLSCLPGVRVVYHEHDAPSRDGSGLLRAARAAVCRRARLVVTPNAERQEALPLVGDPGRRRVVGNYPLLREVAPTARGPWCPPLRIIFQGSIGPKRVPLGLFEALAALPPAVHLTIAGYVSPGAEEHMAACRSAVARLGMKERVRFEGLLQRGELMEALLHHDVGLMLVDPSTDPDLNLRTLVGASNKVYEYLAAGLPVIVPDTPDWQEALVCRRLGVGCDGSSPASIAKAIRFFAESPEALREMGERGRRLVRDAWNYETSFRPVMEVLERSLG
jgi:glycosyltransferase involved in cell wall biosynthesis